MSSLELIIPIMDSAVQFGGKDLELAKSIADRLDTGTVWINEAQVHSPDAPFGGHKESGMGVESSLDGIKEYTNSKTIMIKKK